jgi:hypothetical protein
MKNSENIFLHKWLRISLFNLFLVSCIGVILRYKITFSLPFVDQKYLLNAHSHFAFAGWISQALMTLITAYLINSLPAFSLKKYERLLTANLITAYGMLISFTLTGYGFISIIFSTLSIGTAYAFIIIVWRDLNKITEKEVSHLWFKAAFLFNAVSSLGAFGLAFMMANKIGSDQWYLATIYFFLHFQYNGWFFFACMGLLSEKIDTQIVSLASQKMIFYLFAFACIPAYFLSALWLPIPVWVYVFIVLAAFAQVIGWSFLLVKLVRHHKLIFSNTPVAVKYVLGISAIALSIKLLLQLGSTIPALSTWAFGFRPIVIGYLHLILLGVISLFIIAHAMDSSLISLNRKIIYGIVIFITGIIINELLLLIQGFGAIKYQSVPYVNELLFAAACIMFTGILILNVANKKVT